VTERVAVLGAHGGAGARTVAGLLRIVGAEVELMSAGERLPLSATPVLVARSTAAGLGRAAEMLSTWHAGTPAPWLLVVADLPVPPAAPVRYRTRVLSTQVRGCLTVPYLWPLRGADTVDDVARTKVVQRAARDLGRALVGVGG
jgi:hypothetical protein